jgi:nicotinate-nucleotide pyrophosphorylase (carboxylating)
MSKAMTDRERRNLHTLVELAREEDLGTGDLTGRLLAADLRARARFIARQDLVFCGGVMMPSVARAYDELIEMILWVEEGQAITEGQVLAEWFGPAWAIMAAERVALNFLQRLSGVATLTRQYVEAVAGTEAKLCDTRKTTPGWRELEKYAVRIGGGTNHRRGLYDAVMVKDNHLEAMKHSSEPMALADLAGPLDILRRELPHDGFIEIEVDTLDQLETALHLPCDIILLDNMPPAELRQAVARRNELAPTIQLEASGGVTLETVAEIAATGVERISVGALTHSAPAVDIALDIDTERDEA